MADQSADGSPSAAPARPERDRFDSPPKGRRVGAHRMVMRPRRFWQYLVAALIGVAVLTAAGIFVVQRVGADVTSIFEGGKPGSIVKPEKSELDPHATVAVLNGTSTSGLQDTVAHAIKKGKWGKIAFADVAATNDVKTSAVFYGTKADRPVALGLAKQLGGLPIAKSSDYEQYDVRLVVVLGADYDGPGADAKGSGSSSSAPTSAD